MPLKFMIRACCLAGALFVGATFAAERKPSLIGATREQVLARFGEPKSQIVAGNREVLLFNGERVELRDNRVIEADEIPIEAPPAPKPVAPKPGATTDTGTAGGATTPTDTTTAPGQAAATAANQKTAAATSPSAVADATGAAAIAVPVAPPQPEVVIKSIRPPSADGTTTETSMEQANAPTAASPAPTVSLPAEPAPGKPTAAESAAAALPPSPLPTQATSAASTTSAGYVPATARPAENAPAASATTSTVTAVATLAGSATPSAAAEPVSTASSSGTTVVAAPAPEKAKSTRRIRTSEPALPSTTESIFTTRTYLISLVIVVGGIGYLIWRRRQQSLLLAATAVSNPPFAPQAPATAPGTRFTQDLLNKLEWKRFEELVASYYNKTGVVASRTKKGPASPVHIRISWKGEQRPFACVLCVPHPPALIDAKAVQALCDALAGEDVRRGYVVSSGKFGVPARDLAEEKHITLLPGDIFVEKLNALPDSARAELMRDATAGDYMTPTCPTCESRMTRSTSDPSAWQCPQCGTLLPRS